MNKQCSSWFSSIETFIRRGTDKAIARRWSTIRRPAPVVLVSDASDPIIVAAQLRRLADQIERGARSLPALVSDDGPPMTCYVAETSEALKLEAP